MGFGWFMFGCNLLIPLIFLVGGWMMWKHYSKKISYGESIEKEF